MVKLTVNPADPTVPEGLTATYGQTLADVNLPDNWAWSDISKSVGNAGTNTFKANYTSPDVNHKSLSNVDVRVEVAKANSKAPTGLTAAVGQTLADVTLPDGWTWADSSLSVGDEGTNTFKANYSGSNNYKSARDVDVAVNVSTVAVTGVTLDKTSLSLKEGEKATLTATVAPANASDKTVAWSASPEGVVKVADGKVAAVGAGKATVTVTTADGSKTATCKITVFPVIKTTAGGGETHKIKKDGVLSFKFVYVGHDSDTYPAFVDAGKAVTVSGKNYSKQLTEGTEFKAESGSLKLTLTKDYLDSLKTGDYNVTAKFKGSTA